MISAILFIDQQGEVIISRYYRSNVTEQTADAFRRQVIAAKNVERPVAIFDRTSFMYVKKDDIYVVAVTKSNAHAGIAFEFLYRLIDTFETYFGTSFDENSIRNNFVLIYELLDECMDFGYPQITSVDILSKFIKVGEDNILTKLRNINKSKKNSAALANQITKEITGRVDWREEGKYKYRKNEIYIDVIEDVNILKSTKGEILRNDVSGSVMMRTYLTGMPECQFGVNDKLSMSKVERGKGERKRRQPAIAIEDVRFHRCINLAHFDSDNVVSFIPPDGEFELMTYRVTQNITPPFNISHVVQEIGSSRVDYEITVRANFPPNLFASNVVIKIPTPPNTAKYKVSAKSGKTKYDPANNYILWRFRKITGGSQCRLIANVNLLALINEKAWSRPPITMEFMVPMFTASGLVVRYLKITEKSNYKTSKWVRYITRAGQYQVRI